MISHSLTNLRLAGFGNNGFRESLFQIAHAPDDVTTVFAGYDRLIAATFGEGKPIFPAYSTGEFNTHAGRYSDKMEDGNRSSFRSALCFVDPTGVVRLKPLNVSINLASHSQESCDGLLVGD